jgi:putative oxidoreductase
MLGAITMVHLPHGFFMNWVGQQQAEGYEYHLLVIGMAAALLITGGGRWSVDRGVAERSAP